MVSDGAGDAGVFAALAYSKVRYWCGGMSIGLEAVLLLRRESGEKKLGDASS